MDEGDWLAERFQAHRSHLRAVAYRLLGSVSDADDAVQDAWRGCAWTRCARAPPDGRSRWRCTCPTRSSATTTPPARGGGAVGRGVGLALLVMEQLAPAERLALLLHDTFAVPSTRSP